MVDSFLRLKVEGEKSVRKSVVILETRSIEEKRTVGDFCRAKPA